MEKLLARLVTRDGGDPDRVDSLIVGLMCKDGLGFFKPGYVYEICEVLGEIIIRECGPSWIKPSVKSGRFTENDCGEEHEIQNPVCWGNTIGHVIAGSGTYLGLTEEEYLSLCGT